MQVGSSDELEMYHLFEMIGGLDRFLDFGEAPWNDTRGMPFDSAVELKDACATTFAFMHNPLANWYEDDEVEREVHPDLDMTPQLIQINDPDVTRAEALLLHFCFLLLRLLFLTALIFMLLCFSYYDLRPTHFFTTDISFQDSSERFLTFWHLPLR
jgi:hypothetical protein